MRALKKVWEAHDECTIIVASWPCYKDQTNFIKLKIKVIYRKPGRQWKQNKTFVLIRWRYCRSEHSCWSQLASNRQCGVSGQFRWAWFNNSQSGEGGEKKNKKRKWKMKLWIYNKKRKFQQSFWCRFLSSSLVFFLVVEKERTFHSTAFPWLSQVQVPMEQKFTY